MFNPFKAWILRRQEERRRRERTKVSATIGLIILGKNGDPAMRTMFLEMQRTGFMPPEVHEFTAPQA